MRPWVSSPRPALRDMVGNPGRDGIVVTLLGILGTVVGLLT